MKIKVIHKKGDVENVGNYRPICSLPALYKLFSTILYRRLYPRLDQEQAEDQAGFRSSCNQSSLSSDTKKELEVDDIEIEMLTMRESVRYLGQMITFRHR